MGRCRRRLDECHELTAASFPVVQSCQLTILAFSDRHIRDDRLGKVVPPAAPPPAIVFYVTTGGPNSCGHGFDQWIAADGTIGQRAARRLLPLLRQLAGRKLPVLTSTTPSRMCNSACVYVPAGTFERLVPPVAHLGIHSGQIQPRTPVSAAIIAVARKQAGQRIDAYLRQMGLPGAAHGGQRHSLPVGAIFASGRDRPVGYGSPRVR
jgi:hypothetical protein